MRVTGVFLISNSSIRLCNCDEAGIKFDLYLYLPPGHRRLSIFPFFNSERMLFGLRNWWLALYFVDNVKRYRDAT